MIDYATDPQKYFMINYGKFIHCWHHFGLLVLLLVGCEMRAKPAAQYPIYPTSPENVDSMVDSYDSLVGSLSRAELVIYDTDGPKDVRLGPVVITDADALDKVKILLSTTSGTRPNDMPFRQPLEYEDAVITLIAERPTYKSLRCRLVRESFMYVPDSEIVELVVGKDAYSSLLVIAREKVTDDNRIILRRSTLVD